MSGIVDAMTWTYPFQSLVKYFQVNLIEGRSENWGVSPWYEYFLVFGRNWMVVAVPLIYFFLRAARQNLMLSSIVVAIIVPHSLIAHKEYRFIYPAIAFILIVAGIGFIQWLNSYFAAEKSSSSLLSPLLLGFP